MRTKEQILQGEDEIQFMYSCFRDIGKFCERVLGLTLKPFHKEWLKILMNEDRIVIAAPTGFGKTTIFGIAYPLWLLTYKPKTQILIISRTIRTQSATILEEIKRNIEENEILFALKPEDKSIYWTKDKLNTSNKCKVLYSSYSINIRGLQVDYLFADEIATYPETESFFRDVSTRVVSKAGKIAAVSTPRNTGDLLAQLMTNPVYFSKSYRAIENGESIWPERFSVERLMEEKREIGVAEFEKNYMVNPRSESENAVFSMKALASCFDYDAIFNTKLAKDGQVFMGCDFAISSGPTADFDAYVIVEKTGSKVWIKHGETHKGFPVSAKVRRIEQLYDLYRPELIILDESVLGISVIEELRMKGLPVEAQSFHSQARNVLLVNLKRLIENQVLIIPKNKEDIQTTTFTERLQDELLSFKEVKNKMTGSHNYISTGSHDDTVMALAMACKRTSVHKEFKDMFATA